MRASCRLSVTGSTANGRGLRKERSRPRSPHKLSPERHGPSPDHTTIPCWEIPAGGPPPIPKSKAGKVDGGGCHLSPPPPTDPTPSSNLAPWSLPGDGHHPGLSPLSASKT